MSREVTVRTAGVRSGVVDADREVLGHVLAADYDDVAREVVEEDARRLDGPVVVCESSADSWHLWCLTVRPFDDVVEDLRESRASVGYVDEMARRGEATLRTQPKLSEATGEVVAEAPVPVDVFRAGSHPTPVSRPHALRLAEVARRFGREEVADALDAVAESDEAVGRAFGTTAWLYEVADVEEVSEA